MTTFLPLLSVQFEPKLVDHNETMVHHILVYACGNASVLPTGISECYGFDPAFSLCSQVIVGWAVGGLVSPMMGQCVAKHMHAAGNGDCWADGRLGDSENPC
jgi:hypothetical protein